MPFLIQSKSEKRKNRGAWQQVSLVAGFLAGRHFVGAKDLHYGYWGNGLEQHVRNLPQAQDEYSRFILKHIPADARRILDVGSGAGSLAAKLVARGQEVECVSPSSFLNEQAKELLGDRVKLHECRYEEFHTTEKFDAVVFCESFQYVDMQRGLEQVASQLRSGGSLVICDFFRLRAKEKSPISGGHYFDTFQQIIARFPLRLVEEIDITAQTAPTFTVIDEIFAEVLQPAWDEMNAAAAATHPVWSKFLTWPFRHKIAKFENKYFTHQRSAENFLKFKTYRLMRFERA
jgi:SAM-dependent methyltransferase